MIQSKRIADVMNRMVSRVGRSEIAADHAGMIPLARGFQMILDTRMRLNERERVRGRHPPACMVVIGGVVNATATSWSVNISVCSVGVNSIAFSDVGGDRLEAYPTVSSVGVNLIRHRNVMAGSCLDVTVANSRGDMTTVSPGGVNTDASTTSARMTMGMVGGMNTFAGVAGEQIGGTQ